MPKKLNNLSSRFDVLSTGYPAGGGRQRGGGGAKVNIGSLFSNESNNLSVVTASFKADEHTRNRGGGVVSGPEVSYRHSSNDNISVGEQNSDTNMKHISFAIVKDGIYTHFIHKLKK